MLHQTHLHLKRGSFLYVSLLVLACVFAHLGCSEPESDPPRASGSNHPYAGPMSLDEMVAYADVIVHVEPAESISARTLDIPDEISKANRERRNQIVEFVAALEARFRVVEYLKGTGDGRVTVVIPNYDDYEVWYATEDEALARAELLKSRRSTKWDDRQALLFLKEAESANELDPSVVYPSETYRFVGILATGDYPKYYSLDSKYTRVWLPSVSAPVVSGQAGQLSSSSDDDMRFFTEAPAKGVSAGSSAAVTDTATETTSPQTPSVSKSELRTRIAEIDAVFKEGEGIDGYDECVLHMFLMERVYGSEYGRYIANPVFEWHLDSGLAAKTIIHSGRGWGSPGTMDVKYWLTGPDADLFYQGVFNMDVFKSQGDEQIRSTRPIPEGTYRFNTDHQNPWEKPCNYVPEERTSNEIVYVTAPSGTVHEAFFDPVDEGSSVVADDYRGQLAPTDFSVDSSSTTIRRIGWDANRVWMEFSSSPSLVGHHIDFIELDGSIGLTLDFDDATIVATDAGGQALVWGVCGQPWSDGDLLMLRISESGEGLTGATNDATCDGEAVSMTVPLRTASFAPTSDALIKPILSPYGTASGCGTDGLWACLDEAVPDEDGSLVYLFTNSALRVGFTVGSGDVSGTLVDVRFEVALKAQSGTVDAGAYGFTVYSGSDAIATLSGPQALGSEEWTTLAVSDASILSGLSSGLTSVAFQVNALTSGPRLEWTWVKMVVDYKPTGS